MAKPFRAIGHPTDERQSPIGGPILAEVGRRRGGKRDIRVGEGNDRGSVSVFFVIITLAVLAAAGLVVDGGRKVAALGEARDIADNAARACAQVLDPTASRAGDATLDPTEAITAGQDFLTRTGHTGSLAIGGVDNLTCTAEVRIEVDTIFLPGPYVVASSQAAVGLPGP